MTDKKQLAENILADFASQVESLGGRFSAMACISCDDWESALTKGVSTADPLKVLHMFSELLESARQRYGWGQREMDYFMRELNTKMQEYMNNAG